ncbi:HIT family protein [Amycolatopsis rifamycinica]|uniref:HIT family protein n=1 Tax=Amycolatopsis rifamycinica TaxID=287986 RepID=UPI000A03DB5F|nr:HIT family protein [Amycolatopsis rifamycinica]
MTNIDVPVWDPCPFCQYLSGEREYSILWRDERVAILVTREQRGKSHVLVIPTAHKETVLALTDEESARLMVAVRQVAKAIVESSNSTAISIWQNNGLLADQKVPHVHFHVAGALDGGGTRRGEVRELSVADTEKIKEVLLDFFSID